jgi:2-polyprenyl-6-methoxyphenol hydroxylase-like FAD-dependent oxidoreductase
MGHAVVFGAGLAGLLCARVLADRFERVTVVERDRLSGGPRRGVPQGRHAHALLPRGQEIITDGVFGGDLLILIGSTPANPRGVALFRVEGGRWILSAGGMCGDHPPTDLDGFLDYVATVIPPSMPDVVPGLRAARPPEEIVPARFPTSVRRRYDRLRRLPRGLIAAGDAVCSVDPLYGQGMTAAALQALALRDTLARGRDDLERRYFRAALRATNPVWQLALSADLAFPGVPGTPGLVSRLIGRYVGRVQRAATRDPSCAVAFARVVGLLDPPTALMRPMVVRRALTHGS